MFLKEPRDAIELHEGASSDDRHDDDEGEEGGGENVDNGTRFFRGERGRAFAFCGLKFFGSWEGILFSHEERSAHPIGPRDEKSRKEMDRRQEEQESHDRARQSKEGFEKKVSGHGGESSLGHFDSL